MPPSHSKLRPNCVSDGGMPPAKHCKRAVAGGTFEYHQLMAEQQMEYGPATPAELAWWPRDLMGTLLSGTGSALRAQRLVGLFRHGAVVHSDFTGRQTAECVMRVLGISLAQHGYCMRRDWLAVWRGFDL